MQKISSHPWTPNLAPHAPLDQKEKTGHPDHPAVVVVRVYQDPTVVTGNAEPGDHPETTALKENRDGTENPDPRDPLAVTELTASQVKKVGGAFQDPAAHRV